MSRSRAITVLQLAISFLAAAKVGDGAISQFAAEWPASGQIAAWWVVVALAFVACRAVFMDTERQGASLHSKGEA